MSETPILASLPANAENAEPAQKILDWIRNGRHRTFTRLKVGGLRISGSRDGLATLEAYGFIRFDPRLKVYVALPRALPLERPGIT